MSKSHENTINLAATPEAVFRAITDPEQIVKWFAPYATVDPRVGGKFAISWSPDKPGNGVISALDAPRHLAVNTERSVAYNSKGQPVETGTPRQIVVEYFVEPLDEGITRLRLVQSGFGPEPAWDEEYESTRTGWAYFLAKLKKLLEQ